MNERIVTTRNFQEDLVIALSECEHDGLFVLTDENTASLCWPVVKDFLCLRKAHLLTIPAGDEQKTIATATHVWEQLSQLGATRHSCLINLGGGMVTDLGGFVAATFKRGINFINIPTSLLAMVDASTGGKTGVNLGGLKNEVGVFCHPHCVILHTPFLQTLHTQDLLSGYAEMLKHGLLDSKALWAETLDWGEQFLSRSEERGVGSEACSLLQRSIAVKQRIVEADPKEQGIRKALNLGHTVGHALESYSYLSASHPQNATSHITPLKHGYAVAYGLVCELYLSTMKCGFPTEVLRQAASTIRAYYGEVGITCDDYDALIALMRHDKKNSLAGINFTLLSAIGDIRINQTANDEEIQEALEFLREG